MPDPLGCLGLSRAMANFSPGKNGGGTGGSGLAAPAGYSCVFGLEYDPPTGSCVGLGPPGLAGVTGGFTDGLFFALFIRFVGMACSLFFGCDLAFLLFLSEHE